MNQKLCGLAIFLIISLLSSCQIRDLTEQIKPREEQLVKNDSVLYTARIAEKNLPLFVDLSKYADDAYLTKSISEEVDSLQLSSFLDIDSSYYCEWQGKPVIEVPFREEFQHQKVFISRSGFSDNMMTIAKKYIIFVGEGEVRKIQVVTMIPTPENYESNRDNFSFVKKSEFEGVVLFSSLDGDLCGALYYSSGPIVSVDIDFVRNYSGDSDWMISLPIEKKTKASGPEDDFIDGGVITASICRAVITERPYSPLRPIIGDNNHDNPNRSEEQGHGGGSCISNPEEIFTYDISLIAEGGGTVYGGGTYPSGKTIHVLAVSDVNSKDYFSRWLGDFEDYPRGFNYTVTKHIVAVAQFITYGEQIPCYNLEDHISNPLASMNLAATSIYRAERHNYYGALYGYVRSSGTRKHYGYDLLADIGTPVYSVSSGSVYKIVSTVPSGKEGKNGGGGYGNMIWIVSRLSDGKKKLYCYMHLRSISEGGTTAPGLSVGDTVFAGQLIGYTGNTGNAYNVDNPHLHFEVRNWPGNKSDIIDPADYLNGSFYEDGHSEGMVLSKCDNSAYDYVEEYIHISD